MTARGSGTETRAAVGLRRSGSCSGVSYHRVVLVSRARKLAARVVDVAREPRDRIAANGRRELLDRMASGKTVLSFPVEGWTAQARTHAAGEFHQAGAFHLWDRGPRVTYVVHPALTTALAEVVSDPIPGGIWSRLPHPDPLLVFAEPPEMELATGEPGRLLAVLAHGRRADGALCSTHDAARSGLALMFLVEVLGSGARRTGEGPVDVVRTWVATDEESTVDDIVEHAATRLEGTHGPDGGDGRWTGYLTAVVGPAVATLLYACADGADITTLPSTGRPGRRAGRRPGRGVTLGVGWTLTTGLPAGDLANGSLPVGGGQHGDGPRATGGPGPVPGYLHTYWPDGPDAGPRLAFRENAELDHALATVTGRWRSARAALRDERTKARTRHADLLRAQGEMSRLRASLERVEASRRRLVTAVLRYRHEASVNGNPAHLQALRRSLAHRDEDLAAAHDTIATLADELDAVREALHSRAAASRHSTPPAADTAGQAGPADPVGRDRFDSWQVLVEAAHAELSGLWLAPDLLDHAGLLPARRDWLSSSWNALCALSDYARARAAAHPGMRSGGVRHFRAYLDSADVEGRRISGTQLIPSESKRVLEDPRLRRHRERPGPDAVGGTLLYTSHIRIGQTAPAPRLYFHEPLADGPVCIGYLGRHLPNTLTS